MQDERWVAEPAQDFIKWKLGLPTTAQFERELSLDDLRFDYLSIEGDDIYIIEIRSKPSIDTIARLVLTRELMRPRIGREGRKVVLVLAAESVPNRLSGLVNALDIRLIDLPRGMAPPMATAHKHVKITSDKSWKVVSQLIRLRASSIKRLSVTSGVSYAWAHATMNELIQQNVVRNQEGTGLLELGDRDRLLNGIAWERPTLSLVRAEFYASSDNVFALAREISEMAKVNQIALAFACYLPGGIYTGYSMRHDSLQLYVDPSKMGQIEKAFAAEGGSIKVQTLAPDRDVFNDVVVRESIPLTSPSQTLLDTAGLGHRGKDLALKMMEGYGAIF